MLHVLATMFSSAAGMFALAVIAAMLIDNAPAIGRALRHARRRSRRCPPRRARQGRSEPAAGAGAAAARLPRSRLTLRIAADAERDRDQIGDAGEAQRRPRRDDQRAADDRDASQQPQPDAAAQAQRRPAEGRDARNHQERDERRPRRDQPGLRGTARRRSTATDRRGSSSSPAPAGAGTPVRKPADLCGWSATSILALNRASRSAQHTAWASANSQPYCGRYCSDQR